MPQGSRPDRVAEGIRQELASMLARDVHDPGMGFVTVTAVKVSPDLQVARVSYTILGDPKARRDTERAIERAIPFLRRGLGSRLRLRRVPELHFHFDQSVENQARIERILIELQEERDAHGTAAGTGPADGPATPDATSGKSDPESDS